MAQTGLPCITSFTIKKNGCLIDKTSIAEAIRTIDGQAFKKPVCYMTNCVHPSIVYEALSRSCNQDEAVRERFLGIQANTSPLSYSELDCSTELKCSEPEEFAKEMARLMEASNIKIFGGCCGTDARHREWAAKMVLGKE